MTEEASIDLIELQHMTATGDCAAAEILSCCEASGCFMPVNRNAALQRLAMAARRGSASAWRVLGAAARAWADDDPHLGAFGAAAISYAAARGDAVARALNGNCNGAVAPRMSRTQLPAAIAALATRPTRSAPHAVQQLERPRLHLAAQLLTGAECAYLIALATPRLGRSVVSGAPGRRVINRDVRRSHDASFRPWEQDFLTATLMHRIAETVALPHSHLEEIAIVRYREGGKFEPHFDVDERTYAAPDADDGGPRVVSFIGYLNDAYEGGETAFPKSGVKFSGAQGDAIFFHNQLEASPAQTDPFAIHAGMPVRAGEKWVLVAWFRLRPRRWPRLTMKDVRMSKEQDKGDRFVRARSMSTMRVPQEYREVRSKLWTWAEDAPLECYAAAPAAREPVSVIVGNGAFAREDSGESKLD